MSEQKKSFKVQIPQSIVRGKEINGKEFVLLARLIQAYYTTGTKELTFTVEWNALKHHTGIDNQRKFKECLNTLEETKALTVHGKSLSRNGDLTITLSKDVIPELNDEVHFVQLDSDVLNREFVKKVKHSGVKVLYHIMSYINYEKKGKDHCYVSIKRMSNDMGMSDKTLRNHLQILEKERFIKVIRHEARQEDYYLDKNGNEGLLFDRWNNHIYIREEIIKEFVKHSRK